MQLTFFFQEAETLSMATVGVSGRQKARTSGYNVSQHQRAFPFIADAYTTVGASVPRGALLSTTAYNLPQAAEVSMRIRTTFMVIPQMQIHVGVCALNSHLSIKKKKTSKLCVSVLKKNVTWKIPKSPLC